jgi:2-keto-4-pentenoate hydratase
VAEAIDAVLPAIEEVETRLADREAAGLLWHVADNQANGALVLGPARTDWRVIDVCAPRVRLAFDGETVLDRECRNRAGDPFGQVVRLANLAGAHCGGLRAGQVITTGSLVGIVPAPAGSRVEAEIAGLGTVALRFA